MISLPRNLSSFLIFFRIFWENYDMMIFFFVDYSGFWIFSGFFYSCQITISLFEWKVYSAHEVGLNNLSIVPIYQNFKAISLYQWVSRNKYLIPSLKIRYFYSSTMRFLSHFRPKLYLSRSNQPTFYLSPLGGADTDKQKSSAI